MWLRFFGAPKPAAGVPAAQIRLHWLRDARDRIGDQRRAFQWADGSAYVNHVELVRRARGATMPESFWEDPLMYQGGSDDFLGPMDDIVLAHEEWGIDFEAEGR